LGLVESEAQFCCETKTGRELPGPSVSMRSSLPFLIGWFARSHGDRDTLSLQVPGKAVARRELKPIAGFASFQIQAEDDVLGAEVGEVEVGDVFKLERHRGAFFLDILPLKLILFVISHTCSLTQDGPDRSR